MSTSAAAAATSASSAPSAAPRQEYEAMLRHLNLQAQRPLPATAPRPTMGRTIIEKVSRRGFLKGSAAFALAVQFLPFDAEAYETSPHGGPGSEEHTSALQSL